MTDHKESSNSYLGACIYETHGITNKEKVSLAQVHATLYLAEQQRIANLIAFVRSAEVCFELESTSDWKTNLDEAAVERNTARHAIREGLGI